MHTIPKFGVCLARAIDSTEDNLLLPPYMKTLRIALLALLISGIPCTAATARQPDQPDAAEIYHDLQKLNVLGSALYVAAHPDDENTRLIAWLANEKKLNTAYIAMTRGDGGQNLVGPEIREGLGLIRTNELLEAREIDGGTQFFTRANDFGYSKDPDETFDIWEKEKVLADLVWTIRKFRPDVMITRFNTKPGTTHGHHTASAILAEEAFEAAGDPSRFPAQLTYVEPWQPARLLFNTSWWFYGSPEKFDTTGLLGVDVGAYNAVLGESYTEMAARSRSMHKSQGFGASTSRGRQMEYLDPLKGSMDNKDLLSGINTDWDRIKGGKKVGAHVKKAIEQYDMRNPAAIVPHLVKAREALQGLPDSYWKKVKMRETEALIKDALGLYMEVTADDYSAVPGDSVTLRLEAVNRSVTPVTLNDISLPGLGISVAPNKVLAQNTSFEMTIKARLPEDAAVSEPYWLKDSASLGMYAVDDQQLIGLPGSPDHLVASWDYRVMEQPVTYQTTLLYKRTDPVAGEQYRKFEVTPALSIGLQEEVNIFRPGKAEEVTAVVSAGTDNVSGTVSLRVPGGWTVEPAERDFSLSLKGQSDQVTFTVTPPAGGNVGRMEAIANVGNKTYSRTLHRIEYPHLQPLAYYTPAEARIVSLDIQKRGERIGYIMGAGDAIPGSLQEVGYEVDMLDATSLGTTDLSGYDAIILGVRAYNTVEALKFGQPALMGYVQNGGNVIVQYNTNRGLVTEDLAPYELKVSRDRVTVEEAEIRMLSPDHPVLNTPNRITQQDFEGWVQERGLYFPDEWDEDHFTAVLSSNDPGEEPRDGGLLVARYGEGYYIYTGYSWFRQLPAGVPGAYRLFTNLISVGK
ncbi:PIG-L family deacetylase [Roseivirga sp. BDSF3-8]|uniref:PIG-L family deacetylase n=1 Tax=Roseivirga sp. BDSF3-8 TaxID=3241598 RepID=UPI003531C75C